MNNQTGRCCDPTNITAMQLLNAQRTIENKDVLIRMLREQLKKIEDRFKQNLTDTEQIRYKYCVVNNRLDKMKQKVVSSCSCISQKAVASKCAVGNFQEEMKQWKEQCEKCLGANKERDLCLPELKGKIESFEKIMRDHYSTLIGLVENLSNGKLNEGTSEGSSHIAALQEEIKRLKKENARLNNELETMKRTFKTTEVVYENSKLMGKVEGSNRQSLQRETNKHGPGSVSSTTDTGSDHELSMCSAADLKEIKETKALQNESSIQLRPTVDETDHHVSFSDIRKSSRKAEQEPNKADDCEEDKNNQNNQSPDGENKCAEDASIISESTVNETTQYYAEDTAVYDDEVFGRKYSENPSTKTLISSACNEEELRDSAQTSIKFEGIESTEDKANPLQNFVDQQQDSGTGASLKQIIININDLREDLDRVKDAVQNIEKSCKPGTVKTESHESSGFSVCKQATGDENSPTNESSTTMNNLEAQKSKEGRAKSVSISSADASVIASNEDPSLNSDVKNQDMPTDIVDGDAPRESVAKTPLANKSVQSNVYSSIDPPTDLISFKSGEGTCSNKSQSFQSIFANQSRKECVANEKIIDWPFFKSISKQISGSEASLTPGDTMSHDRQTFPHIHCTPESTVNKVKILTRHYNILREEREAKDEQIKCIEELLNCCAKQEERMNALDECREFNHVDDYLQLYIGKVIEENGKLQSTIETLLGNVKNTVDQLNKDGLRSGREETIHAKKINEECQTSRQISLTISTQYEEKNKPEDLSSQNEQKYEKTDQKLLPSCIFCINKKPCFGANNLETIEEDVDVTEKHQEVSKDEPKELAKMNDGKLKCEECKNLDRGTLVKSLQNYIQNLIDQLDVTKKIQGDIVKLKGHVFIKRK